MLPLAIPVMERLEVVAEPAKKLVEEAYEKDARVVDEFVNVWSALQVFAFAVLSEMDEFEPPTSAPSVPVTESEPPVASDEVPTL